MGVVEGRVSARAELGRCTRARPAWQLVGRGMHGLGLVVAHQPTESRARSVKHAGVAQEAGVVVQRQDESVHLEQDLGAVGVAAQVTDLDRLGDGALQGAALARVKSPRAP